jgi:hypothetical protein
MTASSEIQRYIVHLNQPTFRRKMSPPSSVSTNNKERNQREAGDKERQSVLV